MKNVVMVNMAARPFKELYDWIAANVRCDYEIISSLSMVITKSTDLMHPKFVENVALFVFDDERDAVLFKLFMGIR